MNVASDPWPDVPTLEGVHVALVLLSQDHADDLSKATADGDLSKLWYTTIPAPDDVPKEIDRRLVLRATGSMLPFAVVDKHSGRAVGMTTYMNIESGTPRLEIGSTWYRKSVQRGPLNTECKRLLLGHAFEMLHCIAVEFRTHAMNRSSRRAIERLGAKFDGILRAHMVVPNGTVRDTAVYSVTAPEWPAVRANLDWMMSRT